MKKVMSKIKGNKKSFTLVELLAVIAIMTILVTMALPTIIGQIKIAREGSKTKIIDVVISAAKNYVVDYDIELPNIILISELCSKEYLNCPVINPVDNSEITGGIKIDGNKNYIYTSGNVVNLTYNNNGGSGCTSKQVLSGANYGILCTPKKENANFLGWFTAASGGTAVTSNTTASTDTTIYAHYATNVYTVSYDCNGGFGSIPSSYFEANVAKALATTGCWKIDKGTSGTLYYSKGWATTSTATTSTYTGGQSISTSSNMNLYAIYGKLFDYTGNYNVIDDGGGNWRVKFLTSGTLTTYAQANFDVFLVGGGGAGSSSLEGAGGAGGGGYTTTAINVKVNAGSYNIVVGAGGAATSRLGNNGASSTAFGYTALGGNAGGYTSSGNGGSGGGWGTYGSDGGAKGQGTTTCEFGEGTTNGCTGGDTFAYSGGGVIGVGNSVAGGGGGCAGGSCWNGAVNTGGGGCGYFYTQTCPDACYVVTAPSSGGSGIVIIRNPR